MKNIWAYFLVLSNLICKEKNFPKAIAYYFQNPASQQNFVHCWYKLLKMLGQIFDRTINLGDFTAVNILEETLALSAFEFAFLTVLLCKRTLRLGCFSSFIVFKCAKQPKICPHQIWNLDSWLFSNIVVRFSL